MLLCGSLVSTVSAQTTAQNGWLRLKVDMGPNLTGTNRATALTRLEAIERLVKQVPGLAQPEGFEITTHLTGHRSRLGLGNSDHPEYAIQYILRLTFFAPKWVAYGDPAGEVYFEINADESSSGWLDPQGRDIFVEPSRWPRLPFSAVTYGEAASGGPVQPNDPFYAAVWLTAGGELPWRAVSREDFYAASIAAAEGDKGEKRAQIKKSAEKTGYQRWLEEAPKRKKEREDVLKAIAQTAPGELEKMRKALEDAERESGEEFKKNEASEREDAKTAFASTDSIRAELNRMTPEQRKLPAIADDNATEWRATGVNLRDRDTLVASVRRVLTPNYDFWRARKSPTDIRVMRVYFRARPSPPPVILNAVYRVYKQLDWGALAALLDQPPKG